MKKFLRKLGTIAITLLAFSVFRIKIIDIRKAVLPEFKQVHTETSLRWYSPVTWIMVIVGLFTFAWDGGISELVDILKDWRYPAITIHDIEIDLNHSEFKQKLSMYYSLYYQAAI